MKIYIVMDVNGDILGVATSLETAEKVYNECYHGSCEFGEDKYQEFELDTINNSEILKLFAKELIPKMIEFIDDADLYDYEIYGNNKEFAIKYLEEFLEFVGIKISFEDLKPKPEKRIRKKVKLSEELENF